MKILLKLFLVLAAILLISGPVSASLLYSIEECNADGTSTNKWECIQTDGQFDQKDFQATIRYGDNIADAGAWELAIKDGADAVQAQDNIGWSQLKTNYFEFSYDPTTGAVDLDVFSDNDTYTRSLSWTYDTYKAFDYIALIAKGDAPEDTGLGDNVNLWNLDINGISLPGVNTQALDIYSGVRIFWDDALQQDGFLLAGNFDFLWTTPQDEIPGFQIFAMNTHDLERVPEAGTFMLLGLGLIGLAGLTARRRFKK